MISPRTHALRFRIWQFCQTCEWNTTVGEIAEALGETPNRVGKVVGNAGWANRLRTKLLDHWNIAPGPGIDGPQEPMLVRGF